MGKLAFTPVSVLSGMLAGLVASKLFEFMWGRLANEEAPEPEHRDVSWGPLLAALVVEGAIFRATRGVIDRGSRVAFHRATGTWPGEEKRDRK
jgi:Protein of unknown function (DUF4235)